MSVPQSSSLVHDLQHPQNTSSSPSSEQDRLREWGNDWQAGLEDTMALMQQFQTSPTYTIDFVPTHIMTVEWPEDLIARCTRITVDMSELFILKGRRMDMLANAKAKVNGNANANANVNANANANGEKEEAKNDSDNNNNTIRGETPKQLLSRIKLLRKRARKNTKSWIKDAMNFRAEKIVEYLHFVAETDPELAALLSAGGLGGGKEEEGSRGGAAGGGSSVNGDGDDDDECHRRSTADGKKKKE